MDVHVESVRRGSVLEIAMDRPAKKNALDHAMYAALDAAFARAASEADIRAVLLIGRGGNFTSGNDLADFAAGATPDGGPVQALMQTVIGFGKPIVAAVDGLAIGIGTTILLHCDVVVASATATFRMPFVDLALVPEFASSLLLPRLVGLQKASELLLTGRVFDAEEAERLGLVSRVVEPEALAASALSLAETIATRSAEAISITRRLLRGSQTEIAARSAEEARLFTQRLGSDEARAALAAFFARRA